MATRREAEKAFREAFPERDDFIMYESEVRDERRRKQWEVVVYDTAHSEGSYTAYVHTDGGVEGMY